MLVCVCFFFVMLCAWNDVQVVRCSALVSRLLKAAGIVFFLLICVNKKVSVNVRGHCIV